MSIMRRYPLDENVRQMWKKFPLRLPGNSTSKCHNAETLLVQSMDGGYVSRNCGTCGAKDTLPESVFLNELDLWVACPHCRQRMTASVVEKNYSFVCGSCELYIRLADLLPRWTDLA